jgi:hypothetical protein
MDPGPRQDMGGMMYERSFEDPDGHHWEAVWMDPRQPNRARLLFRRLDRCRSTMMHRLKSRLSHGSRFRPGCVRDLRVRWALEEAGLDYTVRLLGATRHPATIC